jgi:hypothetical protein
MTMKERGTYCDDYVHWLENCCNDAENSVKERFYRQR